MIGASVVECCCNKDAIDAPDLSNLRGPWQWFEIPQRMYSDSTAKSYAAPGRSGLCLNLEKSNNYSCASAGELHPIPPGGMDRKQGYGGGVKENIGRKKGLVSFPSGTGEPADIALNLQVLKI